MYSLFIRHSKPKDLSAIVAIYNQAISSKTATGDTQEFTVSERLEWFATFDAENYPLYIAKLENRVVGYCSISPYREGRNAMQTVAEISYYIDYAYHQKGIGTALIKHAIKDCKRIGKNNLLAISLETNIPSIGLLEKLGFQKWGHFPDIVAMHGTTLAQVVYGLKVLK